MFKIKGLNENTNRSRANKYGPHLKKRKGGGLGGGVRGKQVKKTKETPPKKAKQNKQKIIMVKLNFAKKKW